jgi:hypothetical protein
MTEVYVVTCGSYADYSIVSVYSDRDAAEQRVAGENGRGGPYRDEHRVEVYQLNGRPTFAEGVTMPLSEVCNAKRFVMPRQIRLIHKRSQTVPLTCVEDGKPWPCPTVQALREDR